MEKEREKTHPTLSLLPDTLGVEKNRESESKSESNKKKWLNATFALAEHLKAHLEEYMSRFPKVRIVRTKKREGLIRTRLLGASVARGEVLTFLDSHCEANINWLPPLLDQIAQNPKTIVCPMIDVIDHNHFGYEAQAGDAMRGAFDWEMYYKRIPIPSELQGPDPSDPYDTLRPRLAIPGIKLWINFWGGYEVLRKSAFLSVAECVFVFICAGALRLLCRGRAPSTNHPNHTPSPLKTHSRTRRRKNGPTSLCSAAFLETVAAASSEVAKIAAVTPEMLTSTAASSEAFEVLSLVVQKVVPELPVTNTEAVIVSPAMAQRAIFAFYVMAALRAKVMHTSMLAATQSLLPAWRLSQSSLFSQIRPWRLSMNSPLSSI
ncbi:hypothetical protein QQF64_000959 [Cirrhinus molitorella]|uniref:Glycosyltransferase 2-like domain-containing protein n=1 Tax=Cirrhinus molitorella TaxID=172907 RepID=A0ABR3P031_9TELE